MCAHVLSVSCAILHTQLYCACVYINARPRRHAQQPPSSPAGAALPSLASVTKFHFTKLSRPRSALPLLPPIFDCFLWDPRKETGQMKSCAYCKYRIPLCLFWGFFVYFVQRPFCNCENIVFSNKLLISPPCLHLLRTVRFYALRTEGNRSRRNRELHFHLFCCQKRNLPPSSREMCLPPNEQFRS